MPVPLATKYACAVARSRALEVRDRSDREPYTRGKRLADEIMRRENAGPPRRRRWYALRLNRWLRRHQYKQARRLRLRAG